MERALRRAGVEQPRAVTAAELRGALSDVEAAIAAFLTPEETEAAMERVRKLAPD